MSDVLIRCEHVSKKFCKSLKKSLWYGLTDTMRDLCTWGVSNDALEQRNLKLRTDEFWANQDISFEVKRGECLGLIGRNGAGKTTLLKMLNGLIKPDSGRIELHGRVGALIALGAGFNPILTGRENIHVNGSVLGLSRRQIADSLDEIVDFAELGEFIDTPIQNYSSGMQVRLGFAIAVVLVKPDILLLDEVLAVGDIGFTIKCLNAVRTLAERTAVVFVSHSMQFVSAFCSRVLVLDRGKTICDAADVGEGIGVYMNQFPTEMNIAGNGNGSIDAVTLHCRETGDNSTNDLDVPQAATLDVELEVTCQSRANVWLQVDTQTLEPILAARLVDAADGLITLSPGSHRLKFSLGTVDFNGGVYSMVVGLIDVETRTLLCRHQGVASFRVLSTTVEWGHVVRKPRTNVMSIGNAAMRT